MQIERVFIVISLKCFCMNDLEFCIDRGRYNALNIAQFDDVPNKKTWMRYGFTITFNCYFVFQQINHGPMILLDTTSLIVLLLSFVSSEMGYVRTARGSIPLLGSV